MSVVRQQQRPARAKKAMNPDKLSRFFDGRASTAPQLERSTYDCSLSWDGLSVDPRPFSRLDTRPLNANVTAVSRSTCIAGGRVLELGPSRPGGALSNGSLGHRELPISLTQQDVGWPFKAADNDIVEDLRFTNMHVVPSKVQTLKEVPASVLKSSRVFEGAIMTARERREALDFEVKNRRAKKMQRQAASERRQLEHLLRSRDPEGVLGLDGTANEGSLVYADRLRLRRQREAYELTHTAKRRVLLANRTIAKDALGYEPMTHNHAPYIPQKPFLQTLHRVGPAWEDTHTKIFYQQPITDNVHRRQNLRERAIGNKDYNIVSHCVLSQ